MSDKTCYLDASQIARVAHDAVYRVWFQIGGNSDTNICPWDQHESGEQRDATDAVSSRLRDRYRSDRIPANIPPEYAEFWRQVVDAAFNVALTPTEDTSREP